MSASDVFRHALAALRKGKLSEAERLFKRLVTVEPKHVAGLNLLAVLLTKAGRFEEAEGYIRRALSENASSDASYYNYGIILKALGRPRDALEQFSRALRLNPGVPDTWNNRGTVFKALSRHHEAIADFDKAISLDANYADAYYNKGSSLAEIEQYAKALAAYDRALSLKPGLAEAWVGRGRVYAELKQYENSFAAYDRALSLKPELAEAWLGRGIACTELKQYDDALAAYNRALSLNADLVGAWLGRGYVFSAVKRYDDAFAAYDRALSSKPDLAEAWAGRGAAYSELKQYDKAFAAYDRALALKPDLKYANGFRLHAKMQLCDWTNIDADFSRVLSIIRYEEPLSPFICLSIPSSPADQLNCARVFVANQPAFGPLWHGEIYSHDRIRIAYLSADFGDHPVALLTVGLFEHHDASRFEVTAISYGPERDSALRKRIKGSVEHFVDAGSQGDRDIAEIIRRDEIDIAIDLMGFTENNRFGVLARRPAPIQVNYLGYAGTMGTDCLDYIVADPTIIPEGQQRFYAERVVWLPDSYQVNAPREAANTVPGRRECGLPDRGFVFCAFNSSYKINPAIFDIWMRLLNRVEGSVLWLRQADLLTSQNLYREAGHRGVAPERLIFAPYQPDHAAHLARYRQADLFVDTLPFNAHTTASDALSAGVPVLTCLGDTFAGRVAASVLKSIGLDELIAQSLEQYESLALRLASEPSYLAALKARLADNRKTFPLFDTERATRHIEAAYTLMWTRYQRGEAPKGESGDSNPITVA